MVASLTTRTMAGIRRNMLLQLLLMTMVMLTGCYADITGTNPPIGTCVCTTASLVNVRTAACGIITATIGFDECYPYTGVKYGCILEPDQQFYEFFQLDFSGDGQVGWVAGNYLRVATNSSECENPADQLQVLLIGDYGERLFQGQENVAAAMSNWANYSNPAYIISAGDNFYPAGIRSWDDPQVDTKWRDIYTQPSISSLVWYVTVGNHDYGNDNGNEWNQVELTNHEPRWYLPHLWYDMVEDVGDHQVHFVMIDTEAYGNGVNNYTDMLDWMDATLSNSTADWKIVVGHRNVFSAGDHGPVSNSMLNGIWPIMDRNDVDVYICGHDHNLQHLKNISGYGMDFVVNGAGGAIVYLYSPENEDILIQDYGIETLFFKTTYGFVTLRTRKTELMFEYYSGQSEFLYSFARYPHQQKRHRQ